MANTADVTDITDISGKDRFTNSLWFDELTNTTDFANITSICIIGTNSFTQEQTVLLTFNGLMSLPTLLVLQALRLVALLEHRGLLTVNGLVN